MPLKLDYEFLFVGRDENSFLENYSCDINKEFGKEAGQIFANIEIKNNPVDAEDIAVSIYDTMQNVFFENLSLSPYDRFEATLKAINSKLKDFSLGKANSFIGELNVIIAGVVGEELFISQTGEAEAYLIRKRYVSVISEGLNEEKEGGDVFVNIASGNVEPGDFVLFSNTRLVRYISKNDLAFCVKRGGVMDTLMDIRDVLSTEMLGRLSMTGILFSHADVLEAQDRKLGAEMLRDDLLSQGFDEAQDLEQIDSSQTLLKSDGENESYLHEEKTFFDKKEKKSKGLLSLRSGASSVFSFFASLFSSRNSKNRILIVLVVIILVLVVSIVLANSMSDKRKRLENFDVILNGVQSKITEAETRGTFDKEGASVILDKAYEEALSVLNSGYYRDKANLFLIQINETRDRLDQVVRVSAENIFVDLQKTDPLINAFGIVELSDRKFIFTENKLYELTLDSVQEGIVIDASESIISATGYEDRGSILFLTKSGKILEYREGTVSIMNTEDTDFRKAISINDWGNRIYLLDSVEGQIWRYTFKGSREKFGVAEAYFSEQWEELKGAKDFVIDSYIYVLDSNSEIKRFYAGKKSDLTIINPPYNGFAGANKIYTSEKFNKIVVVDDKANRVFVFDKDNAKNRLTYMNQFLFEGDVLIRGIYGDSGTGKVYVLTDKLIFEL